MYAFLTDFGSLKVFDERIFCAFFFTMNSMPGLEKETQSWSYIRWSWKIRHNGLYLVNCVRIAWLKHNYFRFPASFWLKDFAASYFIHDSFHFGVRQRIQKLILHQILNIYPRIKYINKGILIVQKLHVQYDALKFVWYGINIS